MDTLVRLAPIAGKFLSKSGVSLSQANAEKNTNTNEAEQLLHPFNNHVHNVVLTVVGSTAVTEEVAVDKVTPVQFKVLYDVANMYSQNAILGHGIRLFKDIELYISSLPTEMIAETFGFEVANTLIPHPTFKQPLLRINVQSFMELDSVEQMLGYLTLDVLNELKQEDIFEALRQEALAAVLGKQLTKKESFLKRVLSAAKQILEQEVVTNFGLVVKKKVLAYSDNELEDLRGVQKKMYADYTAAQGRVNGFKKLVKDLARKHNKANLEAYQADLAHYQAVQANWERELAERDAKAETIRQQALTELAELKVVVTR